MSVNVIAWKRKWTGKPLPLPAPFPAEVGVAAAPLGTEKKEVNVVCICDLGVLLLLLIFNTLGMNATGWETEVEVQTVKFRTTNWDK